VFGVIDADAPGTDDSWVVVGIVEDEEVVAGEVEIVVFAGDVEGFGEFAGAGEISLPMIERLGGAH
jgi:hypothetical protein